MEASGIYAIRNLVNDKVYVGSTKNFYNRKCTHFKLLRDNKHWNVKLQRSFNVHGENAFKFEILERVSYEKEVIIERENFFIALHNSKERGYNIADASFGDCLSNHPFREEIIKKISIGVTATMSKLSDEERKEKFAKSFRRYR
jgi:group I intron endonuclease